jgi:hypothetical protein
MIIITIVYTTITIILITANNFHENYSYYSEAEMTSPGDKYRKINLIKDSIRLLFWPFDLVFYASCFSLGIINNVIRILKKILFSKEKLYIFKKD